ncbi:MAG: murein hydrolase activator EnvC family protein [Gemmatimonadales bacterium]
MLLGLPLALLVPLRAPAQQTPPQQSAADRIKEQKDELDRIRQERADLQKRMQDLQSTVHDLSEERTNIERQADATARVVRGLDRQLTALSDEETEATGNLIRAQDELAIKRAVLRNRVREIYKRGPLYSVEAMLSAQSFGELVARYKYLHLIAQRDRALVGRVEALGQQISNQRQTLVMLRNDVEDSRQQKATEEQQLRTLDEQRARSLAQAQAKEKQAETRLAQIAKDEARVGSVIAALEAERKRAEGRGGSAVPSNSTLRTSDFGRLDWPVEGTIIYQFGRLVNPNNTTIRWDGIGIAAPEGTPVKAVAAGTVALVNESLGTYGRTVIIQHGGNDYSIYSSLGKISVAKGAKVAKGQVIGTVGQSDPDMEPHLHFEMRPGQRAVDPLEWLRSRK